MWRQCPLQRKHSLATGAALTQDRAMTSLQALARMPSAAPRGRMPVAGPASVQVVNNNRNNASLPRAGD
jgi:hypothetical protein